MADMGTIKCFSFFPAVSEMTYQKVSATYDQLESMQIDFDEISTVSYTPTVLIRSGLEAGGLLPPSGSSTGGNVVKQYWG